MNFPGYVLKWKIHSVCPVKSLLRTGSRFDVSSVLFITLAVLLILFCFFSANYFKLKHGRWLPYPVFNVNVTRNTLSSEQYQLNVGDENPPFRSGSNLDIIAFPSQFYHLKRKNGKMTYQRSEWKIKDIKRMATPYILHITSSNVPSPKKEKSSYVTLSR